MSTAFDMALHSDIRHRKTMSYHVITRNKSSAVGGAARKDPTVRLQREKTQVPHCNR
jgi:hypothetical protein